VGLGESAVWSGRPEESTAARQRAHAAYSERGARREAARVALALSINHVTRLRFSVAAGWLGKARRHLDGEPECSEHGHVAAIEALGMLAQGNLDVSMERARAAFEIGTRLADRDLIALGLTFQGCVLARQGRRADAMALIDEAMASASSGELGVLTTGLVYCRTLCTCIDLFDYGRALEWSDAIAAGHAKTRTHGFPGDCRAHRAALLVVRGQWQAAEHEAIKACAEAETFDLAHTGLAACELGLLKLRLGELEESERAFRRAHELGVSIEPGMAMLRLASGDVAAAAAGLAAALTEAGSDRLTRAKLLPAQVEVALARGDRATAQGACEELRVLAGDLDSSVLRAAASLAEGRVARVEGDLEKSAAKLREAQRMWIAADAPFEAARARLELGLVLAAQRDTAGAALELRAAAAAFERLGARREAAETARAIEGLA
jgi:tetratricopeptide (TPR) repeat protein